LPSIHSNLFLGEFTIADETGYKVTAKPGDVFYFEKGKVFD
jgi:uncharacterized cupin superfamily protein